ncbi:MAG: hypothetical protein R6V75_08655 [Bacteroidales bacterium]
MAFPEKALMRTICYCRSFLLLALLAFFASLPTIGQDFGQFKPGISWRQIDAGWLRIVFPEGMESQAGRVAGTILYLDEHNRSSIGHRRKKFNVLLNNQGVISNGYVTVMPFRSEFYTNPMQNTYALGSTDWLSSLSIHEYRHALQYMNLLSGANRMAYWLAGEGGWGAMMAGTVPGWYFEGDAVATETALTHQGRGRLPSFTQLSRSLLLSNRIYPYLKMRNGSYRHRVPDQYESGYLLCSYGREHWGNDLWRRVIEQTTRRSLSFYPFSISLERITSLNTTAFYTQAMLDQQATWQKEDEGVPYIPYDHLSGFTRIVTDYQYPHFMGDSLLLVAKKSFQKAGTLYQIDFQGQEKAVVMPGINLDATFSASGPLIAWSEITWGLRYQTINYSDIIVFDTRTGKRSRLTRNQRLFSPALSPDGTRIIALEATPGLEYRIRLFEIDRPEESRLLPNPDNLYFTYPRWDTDGRGVISSARTSDGRMVIVRQDILTGEVQMLTGAFNHILGEVAPAEDFLFFSASFSGINNIYSLDRRDGKVRQLTSSRFGAYYPAVSPDGKTLVYCEYNHDGYRLVKTSMAATLQEVVEPVPLDEMTRFDYQYFIDEGGSILDRIEDTHFESTTYNPTLQGMRLHSWTLSSELMAAGLVAVADNYLQNLHAEGGVALFLNEGAPGVAARVDYGGLFPVISAGLTRLYRPAGPALSESAFDTTRVNDVASLSLSIPLELTRGAWWSSASVKAGYEYIADRELAGTFTGEQFSSFTLHSVTGTASYSIKQKRAFQNISTPLGFAVQFTARRAVNGVSASQVQGIADFGIRGFLPNHNLIVSAGIKTEAAANQHRYLDNFIYPRGFTIPANDRIATVQASYHFPVVYPDFGRYGIFYLLRIRGILFADYGLYGAAPAGQRLDHQMAAIGGELVFDVKWFNQIEMPFGIRVSWLLTGDPGQPGKKRVINLTIPIIRL